MNFEGSMLAACSALLASIRLGKGLSNWIVNWSFREKRCHWMDCLVLLVCTVGWRRKIIWALYGVSTYFCVKATAYTEDAKPGKVKILYSEMVVKIDRRRWNGQGKCNEWMAALRKLVKELKERTVCVFGEDYCTKWPTMKLWLLIACVRTWIILEA